MIKILLITFLAISLASCSQGTGETSASLKVSMGAIAGAPASFPGGLMLYGVSGDKAFGRVMGSDSIDELIPNGTWNFYAVGWDGPNAMEGKVFCGFVGNVNLNGDPVQVNLNATNANCNGNLFTPAVNVATNTNSFPKIEIETCNTLSHVTGSGSVCDYDPLNLTPKNEKGYAASYKIYMKSFDKVGPNYNLRPAELVSDRCGKVNDTTSSGSLVNPGTNIHNVNIPIGTALTPFYSVVRAYLGTDDCDSTTSTKGVKDIVLKKGLNGIDFHYKAYPFDDGGTQKIKIFTRVDEVDVCQGPRLAASGNPYPFAAGRGTTKHPYIICNGLQLNKIGKTYVSNSFKLAKDINLFYNISALFPTAAPPCTSGGDNFMPIGGYEDITGCDDDAGSGVTINPFTGQFDGGFKTISNISLKKRDLNNLGFIRQLDGGALFNLTLENPEFEAKTQVGAGVGKVLSLGGTVQNVNVVKGFIRSGDLYSAGYTAYVSLAGGVVGHMSASGSQLIKNVKVKGTKVEASGNFTAGIIGRADNTDLEEVSFDGKVYCFAHGQNNCDDVGGIAGKLNNGNIEKAAFNGVVEANGQYIGGIAGGLTGTISNLNHFASRGLIRSHLAANTVNVGGLFGYIDDGATTDDISYAYFNGDILHNCTNGTIAGCRVGDIYGELAANSMTPNSIFTGYGITGYGGETGTILSYAGIRNTGSALGTKITAYTSTTDFNYAGGVNSSNVWRAQTNGGHPYMSFEDVHPCEDSNNLAAVTTQDDSRGSAANPIRLCSQDQIAQIPASSYLNYIVADHIYVGNLAAGDMISSFNGVFNGAGKVLYSVEFTINAGQHTGLFSSIGTSGLVKNVTLAGAWSSGTNGTYYSGLLAGQNLGTVENVIVSGDVDTENKAGGVVGLNTGTLRKVIGSGIQTGITRVGGLVGENGSGGVVEKSISRYEFEPGVGNFSLLGGVIAWNNGGTVRESSFEGKIHTGGFTTFGSNVNIGGIVGENTTGTIENTIVSSNVKIVTKGNDKIGGITGFDNGGTISNSVSFANVEIVGATPGNNSGAAVGSTSSSVSSSVKYYNQAYKIAAASTTNATSVSCANNTTESIITFTLGAAAAGFNSFDPSSLLVELKGPDKSIILKSVASQGVYGGTAGNASTTNLFTVTGNCLSASDFDYAAVDTISFKFTGTNNLGQEIELLADIGDIQSYCADSFPGLTEAQKPTFTCSSGWDIIDTDSAFGALGMTRMLDYYTAILQGQTPPPGTPVWEIGQDFPYAPELFGHKD